jgi:hypothetical protein
MHGDHQGALVVQFDVPFVRHHAASAWAASRLDALYFNTPALFTSRLTSAHSRAARATRSASVMSRATAVTPGLGNRIRITRRP